MLTAQLPFRFELRQDSNPEGSMLHSAHGPACSHDHLNRPPLPPADESFPSGKPGETEPGHGVGCPGREWSASEAAGRPAKSGQESCPGPGHRDRGVPCSRRVARCGEGRRCEQGMGGTLRKISPEQLGPGDAEEVPFESQGDVLLPCINMGDI